MCVCAREREREREKYGEQKNRVTFLYAVFRTGVPRLTLLTELLRLIIYVKERSHPQENDRTMGGNRPLGFFRNSFVLNFLFLLQLSYCQKSTMTIIFYS
ncbi:hypothetical protein P5V15_009463 [Pogonomyrmex californicus]